MLTQVQRLNWMTRLILIVSWFVSGCASNPMAHADSLTVTQHIVKHSGVQIEVLAQGKGPLVVMLPSLGRSATDFDDLATRVASAGFRVLRPQPRGIGASVGPMKNLTLHDLAADVAAIIEKEGSSAIVAGHAYGNFVARTLAMDRPDLVRAVILLAPAGRVISPEMRNSIVKSGDPAFPREERLTHLKKAFFFDAHDPSVWLDGWYPAVGAMQREANDATKDESWRKAGQAPLLVIRAKQDALLLPSRTDGIPEELGERVSVVEIDRAGHALVPEQPGAVAEAIIIYAHRFK